MLAVRSPDQQCLAEMVNQMIAPRLTIWRPRVQVIRNALMTFAVVAIAIASSFAAGASATTLLPDYPSSDIELGFRLTVFGREGPRSDAGRYVNKFVDPVAVTIRDNSSAPQRRAEVARFVELLNRTVPNLKISMARKAEAPNLFVFLVNRSDYRRVIADAIPKGDQTSFLEGSRCSAMMWNRSTGVIDRAYVFVVADQGDSAFTSCLAEELTQALGPANDSDRLTYSLYNDRNDVGTFGMFDWYVLSTLYDRDILAGINEPEAVSRLPKAIQRLRQKAGKVAPLLAKAEKAP